MLADIDAEIDDGRNELAALRRVAVQRLGVHERLTYLRDTIRTLEEHAAGRGFRPPCKTVAASHTLQSPTLPAQIIPADTALKRRHHPHPVETDYKVFRECLRWEFGFTCAICLLRARYNGVRSRRVGPQIEHLVPRSQDSKLIGVYTNLSTFVGSAMGRAATQTWKMNTVIVF